MRKLNRRGGGAPAAPAQAQTITPQDVATVPAALLQQPAAIAPQAQVLPPAQAPAAAPAQVTALVPVDANALAALTGSALLQSIGGFERPEHLNPDGIGLPYLAFYSQKSGDAADVIKNLGNVGEGTPYVKAEGNVYAAAQAAFLTIREFPFWVTLDKVSYRPNRAWITPQGFGASFQGDAIKEQIIAITLILPGVAPLHEDLAPAMPTLTTWRATKCGAVKQHVDAMEATIPDPSDKKRMETANAWAQANGQLVNLLPRFRLCSTLRMEPKSGANGPYSLAKADTATISAAQMVALTAWSNNEDLQEEFRLVMEGYERAVVEVRNMAANTAKGA